MQEVPMVQNCLSLYTDAVNRRAWTELGDVFVREGTWACGEPTPLRFEGVEAIVGGLRQAVEAASNLVQFNTPAVIRIEGDRALARSTIIESAEFADRAIRLDVLGMYEDELIKTALGWRFASRTFRIHRLTQASMHG